MAFLITSVFFNPVLRAAAEKDPNVLRALRPQFSKGGAVTPEQQAARGDHLASLMKATEAPFLAGVRPSLWARPGSVPAAGPGGTAPPGQSVADKAAASARQGPVGQMSAGSSPFGRRQAGKAGAGGSLASIAAPVGKSDVPAAFTK